MALDADLQEALSVSLRGAFGSEAANRLEELQNAAAALRSGGLHFFAGWTSTSAIRAAWGELDKMRECADAARRSYMQALESADPRSPESIASLKALSNLVGMDYAGWFEDRTAIVAAVREINEELAQRLLSLGRESTEHGDSILVRGLLVTASASGEWTFSYPEFEVDDSSTTWGPEGLTFTIPSAFHLFVRLDDWVAADEVAKLQESAFTSPGLRGWRTAVSGLLDPDQAVERFADAAEIFATDTHPGDDEILKRGRGWDSRNVDLWAKFFRARSLVAQVGRDPSRALELLEEASNALGGTESGWVNPQVSCLRILTKALTEMLTGDPQEAARSARKQMGFETRLHGVHDYDTLAIQFLDVALDAFSELSADPGAAVVSGTFPTALQLLGRIPLLSQEMPEALRSHIAKKAGDEIWGSVRTWVHRTLESITDEDLLRRLLLRLYQSGSPKYAHIRHSPIEYGKDIVVLSEEGADVVLRMYQAKIGDITKPKWRIAQPELEEIFLVDLDSLQLPIEPTRREGVLVFNGHVHPYAEPVVSGWLKAQERDHARIYRLETLDTLVSFITGNGLSNEFRAACHELGIAVIDAVSVKS